MTKPSSCGVLLAGRRESNAVPEAVGPDSQGQAWLRLLALAVMMVLSMFALPRLGMVWTCMVVFVLTAFLFRTRHPVTAVVLRQVYAHFHDHTR